MYAQSIRTKYNRKVLTEHNQYNLAAVKGTEFPFADICIILVGDEIREEPPPQPLRQCGPPFRLLTLQPSLWAGCVGSCRLVVPHHTSAIFTLQPSLWAGCVGSCPLCFAAAATPNAVVAAVGRRRSRRFRSP